MVVLSCPYVIEHTAFPGPLSTWFGVEHNSNCLPDSVCVGGGGGIF